MTSGHRARSGRLGIGIVGAGKVGAVLGAALAGAGHAIVGVSTISTESRERVDAILPGVPFLEIPLLIQRSELVLMTVPTDQLSDLVTGLASLGVWQPGQLVVHTAAAYGTAVLAPAVAAGAIGLAIHPAMVFTGSSLDIPRLSGSYCAVTAPAAIQPIGHALVVEMGAEPCDVAEKDRPAYADALEKAANFSTSVAQETVKTLAEMGIPSPAHLLAPLLHSAVDSALFSVRKSDDPLP